MLSAKQLFDLYFNKPLNITTQQEFEQQVILPAMEAYREQCEELAFNAAASFTSYQEYKKSLSVPVVVAEEDSLRAHLEQVADTIVQNYIPDDRAKTDFSFSFSTDGTAYTVFYVKDADGYWQFTRYEEQ